MEPNLGWTPVYPVVQQGITHIFSWINFLIFALVILSSVYLTVLSSNLFASREGRNRTTPLRGSRYHEMIQSIPGLSRGSSKTRIQPPLTTLINIHEHSKADYFLGSTTAPDVPARLFLIIQTGHGLQQRETRKKKQWGCKTPIEILPTWRGTLIL